MTGFRCMLAQSFDDKSWQLEVPMPPFMPFAGMDVIAADVQTTVESVSWFADKGLLVAWICNSLPSDCEYDPGKWGWSPATFWGGDTTPVNQEAGNG